jgi:hypothetical protein
MGPKSVQLACNGYVTIKVTALCIRPWGKSCAYFSLPAGARLLLRREQRMVHDMAAANQYPPARHNLCCICLTVSLQVHGGCCAGSSAWCWAPPPGRCWVTNCLIVTT